MATVVRLATQKGTPRPTVTLQLHPTLPMGVVGDHSAYTKYR